MSYAAHIKDTYHRVEVSDHTGENQRAWDGRVIVGDDDLVCRLVGDDYDLWGSGTGDMVVRALNMDGDSYNKYNGMDVTVEGCAGMVPDSSTLESAFVEWFERSGITEDECRAIRARHQAVFDRYEGSPEEDAPVEDWVDWLEWEDLAATAEYHALRNWETPPEGVVFTVRFDAMVSDAGT